jgi:hypothetical protein
MLSDSPSSNLFPLCPIKFEFLDSVSSDIHSGPYDMEIRDCPEFQMIKVGTFSIVKSN